MPGLNDLLDGLGGVGDSAHNSLVRRIVDQETFLRTQLETPFRNMLRWHRLYLGKYDDFRGENEQWRANVHVPYPYSQVETSVATITDILFSADPLIQVEGVQVKDEKSASPVELYLDLVARRINWRRRLDGVLRERAIQGTVAVKNIWSEQRTRFNYTTSSRDLQAFGAALDEAKRRSGENQDEGPPDPMHPGIIPDPAHDPAGFEAWRKLWNVANPKFMVPEAPLSGRKEIINFRGPMFVRVPIWDLRFDPLVEEYNDQPFTMHRVLRPLAWVLDRADDSPLSSKPFILAQVLAAGKGSDSEVSQYRQQIADWLGVAAETASDPMMADVVELWEIRMRGTDYPAVTVMNQKAIINKHPGQSPYWIGENEVSLLRNVPVEGMALGISDLQHNENLYHELNSHRNLGLDRATIDTLPIFTVKRAIGLPELHRYLTPGAMLPVESQDQIQMLTKSGSGRDNLEILSTIKADIDDTAGTQNQVRGGESTVGRVSATESQDRMNRALVRSKTSVIRCEEELQPSIRMWLALEYQFGNGRMLEEVGAAPLAALTREMLEQSFTSYFRFRGASQAINRDMRVNQLVSFQKVASPLLMPQENRALLRRIYDEMGQKGGDVVVSEEGTRKAQGSWQLQQDMAMKQMTGGQSGPGGPGGAVGTGGPQEAAGGPPGDPSTAGVETPDSVPLAALQALTGGQPPDSSAAGALPPPPDVVPLPSDFPLDQPGAQPGS